MSNFEQHHRDVKEIRQQLLQAQFSHSAVTLSKTTSSNMTRSKPYKEGHAHLNISKLNRMIHIDKDQRRAFVEPKVSMEELVDATLKHGMIPPVLPEFKGITVGGAIMGAAIESSSYLYGQFNDTCHSYDILVGDGSIVHATPSTHSDLFYGISGSYGTLGLVLLAEIDLIPAQEYVHLTYHHCETISDAVALMNSFPSKPVAPDFFESLVFAKDKVIVIEGKMASTRAVKHLSKAHFGRSWNPWYYQHLKRIHQTLTSHETYQDAVPIKDYLFRHDRGAFWMGSYVLHGPLLSQFISQTFLRAKHDAPFDLSSVERKQYGELKTPNFLTRLLFGWAMDTKTLYKVLHGNRENWFEQRFVIQDYYLPHQHVANFSEKVIDELGINPLWLCPVRPTSTPQILSPHYQPQHQFDALMYDVGVYGMPKGTPSLLEINRQLESWSQQAGGRKMFYSASFYTPEEFWEIYPQNAYQQLRKRYHAEGIWLPIDQKVLQTHV